MSTQNLTIKSQEILQQAQQLAFTAGNANIETEHILKALLNDKDSPVAFVPGSAFFSNGGGENTMRLNFSHSTPAQISDGVTRLAGVIEDMQQRASH